MIEFYTLYYKVLDKLGRTKTQKFVGVFSSKESLDAAKKKLEEENSKITFDVYVHEKWFSNLV